MTLTAIRSLGKRGIPVVALEYETTGKHACLGFYSKYVDEKIRIPDPAQNENAFVDALLNLGRQIALQTGEKPVLIVPGSQSMSVLTRYTQALSPIFETLLVDHQTYLEANNTQTLLKKAKEIGVNVPLTTWLYENDDSETVESLADRIEFPVVVKYREGEKLPLKAKERYEIINERSSFIAHYTRMHQIQPSPLVQEYVLGSGYGVSAVFDEHSHPIEIFVHERLREYPTSGGPSTFCQSIWDDKMVSQAIELLKALSWKGYAMVEFKGQKGGAFRLMEINPRFWGSMALSLVSGCDLAYKYYASLSEEKALEPRTHVFANQYKLGAKMRFRVQDLLAIKSYYFGRKSGVRELLNGLLTQVDPTIKDGLFSFDDPMPGLMYYLGFFKR
jgi:predicted ATP-grasp superfamily ATP-dependent carboligase